jgi:hypothetical protein
MFIKAIVGAETLACPFLSLFNIGQQELLPLLKFNNF